MVQIPFIEQMIIAKVLKRKKEGGDSNLTNYLKNQGSYSTPQNNSLSQ
jgi:hypothetical protein